MNDSKTLDKYLIFGIVTSIGLFTGSYLFDLIYKTVRLLRLKKTNTLAIVYKYDETINLGTYLKFVNDYKFMDKDKDIYIVIQTLGGKTNYAESICNVILSHKGKGKIKCYIPNYALSGGSMIALCCDEIIMTKESIITPCDSQITTSSDRYGRPATAIMESIAYKKSNEETIREEWLILESMAKKCIESLQMVLDKLCKIKSYNDETKKILHEDFFSGKYIHSHNFTAQSIIDTGCKLPITIVDEIPDDIKTILELNLDEQ